MNDKKNRPPSTAVDRHRRLSKIRQGFTLLELLVVLVLLGILAAALFPAITMAVELARSTACKSNLRQMAVAAHAYAGDNDDEFPPCLIRNFKTQKTTSWEDILWGYDTRSATSEKIHQCPSFKGAANWSGDRYTGYNYNSSYIGAPRFTHGPPMHGMPRSAMLGEIRDPSRCALFGDGQYESGANKFMRSPFPGPLDADGGLAISGTQGFRHRGSTNVAFADTSVRSLKTRHVKTAGRGAPAKNCGFLSEDNSMYDLD